MVAAMWWSHQVTDFAISDFLFEKETNNHTDNNGGIGVLVSKLCN